MAVTRIKNNQITDLTVNAAAKLQDYTITSGKIANNLTYGSDLTITGNLTVNGNTTTIDTVNLVVEDPLILLAKEQTGSPTLDIGFIGKRGTSDNIAFVWDEGDDAFVTAFTDSETTNTVINVLSYASFKTLNANITGNIDVGGNISITGNLVGDITVDGNVNANNFLTSGIVSATGNVTGGNVLTGGAVSATANVTGGNVLTGGLVSAGGTVTGSSLLTGGIVSATGTITGGNLATGGTVSGTGNITGGNVLTGGLISATGNLDSGNVNTTLVAATTVSASGNVTGGNVLTGGAVSATANITGGNVLTGGVISATGNINSGANIVATANVIGGNITTAGQVSATGNGTFGNISTAGTFGAASLSASGNITGGNLLTGGLVSAGGTVTGSSVLTGGTVSATGTITGGNLATGGTVSSTGNITGGNVLTGGLISATGNLDSGNVNTVGVFATTASASGNVTGGNVLTGGAVSAAGTVTGSSLLTGGVVSAAGTVTGSSVLTGGIVSATGNVTGGNINSAGLISTSANVVGGNLITTGLASVGGNVIGGNVLTGGIVSATGNIQSAARVITPEVTTASGDLVLNSAGGALQWDGTGNIVLNSQWINNLADPTAAQDAATKQYVDDAVSAGIHIHTPVDVETPSALPTATYAQGGNTFTVNQTIAGNIVVFTTAANLQTNDQLWFSNSFEGIVANTAYFVVSTPNTSAAVLSTSYNGAPVNNITSNTGLTQSVRVNSGIGATLTATANGALTVDSYAVSAGNRVLVYNQLTQYENGIYDVTDAGNVSAPWILTRSADADTYIPDNPNGLDNGSYVYVKYGSTGAGESYVMTAPIGEFIIGYANVVFTQFSASQVYSANTAAGLSLSGTVFSAKVDNDTTAFDGGGNISVKAGANLVTPNIGAATGTSLSATGNVTGGNINTGGLVSAAGTVTGSSVLTGGTVSAAGTVTGSSLLTGGIVSATGNVTGGNINTAGAVSATGNVNSGNVNTTLVAATTVSATGNVNSGNINTGLVSATGNVVSGNINTGIVSATGNVAAVGFTGGNASVTGNVYAANFIGNVSGNVVAAGANTQIQFNDDSVLGATANLTFDKATNSFTVSNGNITGGNLLTGGLISATANITGGNVLTGGVISATGNINSGANIVATANVIGGNITTGGVVSATGDVTGGNIVTGGNASVTGNVNSGNVNTTLVAATTVSASGNVTGGNVLTGGLISAGGTVTGSSLLTGGTVSAAGTVTGSSILTGGVVSATGNVTGGNVLTGGLISAAATVTGSSLLTGGTVSATGTITGGNLVTAGNGNIGNIRIAGDDITGTNGVVTFNDAGSDVNFRFEGDTDPNLLVLDAGTDTVNIGTATPVTGAKLNIGATNSMIVPTGNTAQRPGTGQIGMFRFNTNDDALEVYATTGWEAVGVPAFTVIADDQFTGDGSTVQFTLGQDSTTAATIVSINGVVQIPTTAYSVSGNVLTFTEAPLSTDTIDARTLTTTTTVVSISNSSGNAVIGTSETADTITVTGNIIPTANIVYDLGNTTNRFNDLYLAGNTITLGNCLLKNTTGNSIGFFGPDGTTPATIDAASVDTTQIANGTSSMAVIASGGNIRGNVGGSTITNIYSSGLAVTGLISATGTVTGTTFVGVATSAQYADLAEMYAADQNYEPGTVLSFGGAHEVTLSSVDADSRVAGVVSTNPSYLMNSALESEHTVALALTGRVPTHVTGCVRKGDMMVSNGDGTARAEPSPRIGTVIGKALEDFDGESGVIEVVIGRL